MSPDRTSIDGQIIPGSIRDPCVTYLFSGYRKSMFDSRSLRSIPVLWLSEVYVRFAILAFHTCSLAIGSLWTNRADIDEKQNLLPLRRTPIGPVSPPTKSNSDSPTPVRSSRDSNIAKSNQEPRFESILREFDSLPGDINGQMSIELQLIEQERPRMKERYLMYLD